MLKHHLSLPVPIHAEGPWPFVTRRSYVLGARPMVWLARQQRKGLAFENKLHDPASVPLWQTSGYNWAIGAAFALGSALFMLGALLSLIPAQFWTIPPVVANCVFFIGSIPFTIAAALQHIQSANAPRFSVQPQATERRRLALIGWHPRQAGWLSTFTQLLGTLAFNADTLNAIASPALWYQQDSAIWLPDIVGSVLFLISGYLAFIETSHRYWSWMPRQLGWQIVFINFLGCIAFLISAILSFVPQSGETVHMASVSTVYTFIGGACFLAGALLTCRESRLAAA